MRAPVVVILSLACAGLALAPRSAADELQLAALEPDASGASFEIHSVHSAYAETPAVGVERSPALRMANAPRGFFQAKPEPVPFTEQIASGLQAFHLPVYVDADPAPARGAPFAAAGLKVGLPGEADEGALCATLMLCLMEIDRLAQSAGQGAERTAPLVVVIDATLTPAPEPATRAGRAVRAVPTTLSDAIPTVIRDVWASEAPRPSWDVMLAEVATALPRLDASRLVVVLMGGMGGSAELPAVLSEAADAVMLDGADARVLRADAAPEAVAEAVMSGAFTVVLGADWSGEGDPTRLGPRQAASLGAHAVIVTPASARRGAE